MSTQITISGGGGTLLEGDTYKYIYANDTPINNGFELLNALDNAEEGDTILLGPGNYSLNKKSIGLGIKKVQIKGLVPSTIKDEVPKPFVNITYFDATYNQNIFSLVDSLGNEVNVVIPSNWQYFINHVVKIQSGSHLYFGYFFDGVNNYNVIRINSSGVIDFQGNINQLGNAAPCYYKFNTSEYLVCSQYGLISIYDAVSLTLLNSYTINGEVQSMTNGDNSEFSDVYIAGPFSQVDVVSSNRLVKINILTGLIDTTFSTNIGTGPGGQYDISFMSLTSTALVFGGGNLQTFNGNTVNGCVYALNFNGTVATTLVSNFGSGFGGFGYPSRIFCSNGKIIMTSNPYSATESFNGNTYSTSIFQLSETGVYESDILDPGFKCYGETTRLVGNTLIISLFQNTSLTYGGYEVILNTTSYNISTGQINQKYLTASQIPPTGNLFQTSRVVGSDTLYIGYSVSMLNDPAVFHVVGNKPYTLENINFGAIEHQASLFYNEGNVCNCVFSTLSGINSGQDNNFYMFLDNCTVTNIYGSIVKATNCQITRVSFNNPTSSKYVNSFYKNCRIGELYVNMPNVSISGTFTFNDCLINTGLKNIQSCSAEIFGEECQFSNFALFNTYNAYTSLQLKNCHVSGICFIITHANTVDYTVKLENIISTDYGSAFIFEYYNNSSLTLNGYANNVTSLGSILNNNFYGNATINIFNQFKVYNSKGGGDSFNVNVSSSDDLPNTPFEFFNCNAGINSFNYNRNTPGNGSVSFINCTSEDLSFNCLTSYAAGLNDGHYNNCTVINRPGSNPSSNCFQVVPMTPESYMLNCMMIKDSVAFLDPATNGGAGKVISCRVLSTSGVLTTYNY
jgi:hypothetical protein